MLVPFDILRLGPHDLSRMRALNALFGDVFRDPDSYHSDPPDDAWLTALLGKDHLVVLAAVADGEVIGGLAAYELDKFERARRELYIYDLGVAETHRRRGVATALIGRLQAIARDRSAWVIFVQADYGDDPAIALYEKLGAREEVLHYDIPPARR